MDDYDTADITDSSLIVAKIFRGTKSKLLLYISFAFFSCVCLAGTIIGTVGILNSYSYYSTEAILFILVLGLMTLNILLGSVTFMNKLHIGGIDIIPALSKCHVTFSCTLVGLWLFCRSFVGECTTIEGLYLLTGLSCDPQYTSC